MIWWLSHCCDPALRALADRHYSRQKPGTPRFVPPGRCVVYGAGNPERPDAVWATSWPFAEYVKHRWAGAWVNSIFRKECPGDASAYIRDAIAATRTKWADVPPLGLVTFINRDAVPPIRRRGKHCWGYSYLKAGFTIAGETEGGHLALQILPAAMPEPKHPMSKARAA